MFVGFADAVAGLGGATSTGGVEPGRDASARSAGGGGAGAEGEGAGAVGLATRLGTGVGKVARRSASVSNAAAGPNGAAADSIDIRNGIARLFVASQIDNG